MRIVTLVTMAIPIFASFTNAEVDPLNDSDCIVCKHLIHTLDRTKINQAACKVVTRSGDEPITDASWKLHSAAMLAKDSSGTILNEIKSLVNKGHADAKQICGYMGVESSEGGCQCPLDHKPYKTLGDAISSIRTSATSGQVRSEVSKDLKCDQTGTTLTSLLELGRKKMMRSRRSKKSTTEMMIKDFGCASARETAREREEKEEKRESGSFDTTTLLCGDRNPYEMEFAILRAADPQVHRDLRDEYFKTLTYITFFQDHPDLFSSCHPTGFALRELMGTTDSLESAGIPTVASQPSGNLKYARGTGYTKRKEAVDLVVRRFENPGKHGVICQIRGTSTPQDGHSFELVLKPNGYVDVLEGWGSHRHFAGVCALVERLKKNIPVADAIAAVKNFVTRDHDDRDGTRTRAYRTFSISGYASINFELVSKSGEPYVRIDDDDQILLQTYCNDLKEESVLRAEIARRLEITERVKRECTAAARRARFGH